IDLCLESNGGCHTNAECIKTGPRKVACNCLPGYSGNGVSHCNPINLCEQNNGGCSPFGLCKYTGPGTRNCSCSGQSVGDGFTCHGKVYQFEEWKSRGLLRDLLRYHMVGCQKLLSSDLEARESLTSLSGHEIKTTGKENSIYLNEEAKVVVSDIIGVNGVIHFINKILIPSDLVDRNISSEMSQQNITEVAEAFGYTIYSKLLQDAELLPLVSDPLHRPFTMLWPTDAAFNNLSEKRQKWLYRREHRDVLASYLKAHMIRDTKIVAGNVPQLKSIRTMHGSTISFSCSKAHVGELLVGNGDATIIQRHMEFNGGIAYGINRLLEPPDLGSRCDEFVFVELQGSTESCGPCGLEPPCPAGSVEQAVCRSGNLCECDLHYEGDGRTCLVIDMCGQDNGGCAGHAQCTQVGVNISCACSPGYRGDGYVCEPIDRCADGRNGDCSEHANCISTGPNERRCECKRGYVGDGIQCLEEAVPPTDRCLEDNGQCHREAICTDLHFHDKTMGVFHLQSPRKKYDFTYEQAQEACATEGASLATFQQLSAAQQMGFHLCLVGWLDNGTAGYPTAYPSPSCGANRVGIVDYGSRSNLSETWDAFCYREKDLTCTCRDGFVGDGYWCSGKLPDVLADHARFSTFYSMLLDFANGTEEGLDFFNYLSDDSTPKTLFVPLNSGFADNETLTGEDLKLHVSSSNIVLFSFNLTTGTIIPSQSGYDLHVSDLPVGNSTEHAGAKGINDTMIVEWDIMAFNGIIHAIAEPLKVPPPRVHLGQ
ncbi:PREDICTED: stabilin-1-like, partial [Mesitornis unicolor]|uniref:stabilin-1-like n=1 Tax=Mesitornis unicolor TaxID=54374 RepID=UPI0005292D6E